MTKINDYVGVAYNTPAPGDRISVHTPLALSQRPLNITKVKEYVKHHQGVDWNLFGYVTAMRLKNGEMLLVDGQHRRELVKTYLPDVQEIPAHIIDGTPELSARYFYAMNGGSSSHLKSEEVFWAKLQAGDEFATSIADTLSKTQWSVGKVNTNKANTRSCKYANAVKSIGFSEDAFIRSTQIIDEVFPTGPADNLLSGMSRLLSIPQYAELGNPNKAIGKQFVQWLKNIKAIGASPKNLEFKKYRNTGPWYDAVAYGLARHFFQSQRSIGRSVPSIRTIKDIWERPMLMADDFESLVF